MPEFKVHSQEQQAVILAAKIPDGKAWADKYIDGTVMRNLLIGLGLEFLRLEDNLNYTNDELGLRNTSDLITEWETEYGIGSSCFAEEIDGDLEDRINNILIMIAGNGTSIAERFEEIALLLGVTVIVTPGTSAISSFKLTFPITFNSDLVDARYTILVTFPDDTDAATFTHTFPFTFGDTSVSLLKCFFNILKPSNCEIVYPTETFESLYDPINYYKFGDSTKLVPGSTSTDIEGWIDTQGNNDLAQLTEASQPVYDPLNGALIGDGTKSLDGVSVQSSDFTYIFNVKMEPGDPNISVLVGSSADSDNYITFFNGIFRITLNNVHFAVSFEVRDGLKHIMAVTLSGTTIKLWADGVLLNTITGFSDSISLDRLLSRFDASVSFFGEMYDALIYDKALSTDEIKTVTRLLSQ